ncbi:MAG: hypothetical protein HOQ29_09795 [Acidobacteria bacterium]|nr:hypothetical protein [Acidobacteriota bacterium]
MRTRSRVLAAAVALAASASLSAQSTYTKQDAARFQTKLAQIVQQGTARSARAPRATQVTDAELNAYLKYSAGSQVPVGIVDPQLNALGNGRVGGRALVDLDAVRTQKKRGWTDPMGYLTGRLPITATGTLSTQHGIGRFQLESAEISGVTIPKTLLQELLSYYSKTRENPAGINMDDPFELPAGIKEIKVGKGAATIVQ